MTTAPQLAALVQEQQAQEAAALEEQAAQEADGGAAEALAAIAAAAVAGWAVKVGTWDAGKTGVKALAGFLADLRARIRRALSGLGPRAARVLRGALGGAVDMGVRHAGVFARRASGALAGAVRASVPRDAVEAAESLARAVADQVQVALRLLTPAMVRRLGGLRGVVAGIGAARRAVSMVRARVAWAVQRTINAGSAAVADALGLGLLWIAELEACPTCRALSGRYAAPGDDFPGGVSLDPRQRRYFPDPIPGPPRHPHCRCKTVPWSPAWRSPLPARLRARARAA